MKLAPTAGKYYLDNSDVACIMGPIGSGKTVASELRLQRHAFEQPPAPDGVRYSRWGIVRNTHPQLQRNTMESWFQMFPKFRKGSHQWVSTKKMHVWNFALPDKTRVHAEFVFAALDDEDAVADLMGLEVTGFWFNELRLLDPLVVAQAATRAGRYPNKAMGGCKWWGWIADTNPWSSTSEYHSRFVVSKPDGWAFFRQPGGMDPAAENLANLPGGREYYVKALSTLPAHEVDTLIHCKYGVSRDGRPVYVSYDDNFHCQQFELAADGGVVPILIGYDDTGRNPAAVVSQKTRDGQWRVRYEFCGQGIGMKAHAAALRRFLAEKIPQYKIQRITCDPAGRAKGADDLDMRMIIQREFPGVSVLNARTNDVATRIEAVDGTMRRNVNGAPAVVIHPDCKNLREACIAKYHYRKLKLAGEERFTEVPEKVSPYADVADALQYLLLGGGEGRINSDGMSKEPQWPANGAAITPKAPEVKDQERGRARPVFDPRTGSVFRDGW
ncbi:MAG: hypothetical protein KGL39_07290 [Patescibacteria group bacterium]|nr:hypothetical protein [Patescibacteria group bacterium]